MCGYTALREYVAKNSIPANKSFLAKLLTVLGLVKLKHPQK